MNFKLAKISATNLATLAADDFCPRCFWLKARLGFKNPFAMFPKIFNELDSYQKAFTESYLKDQGVLPPWLSEYKVHSIVPVPGYGNFGARHECGVLVTGVTDHLMRLEDMTNLVLDYKTSRPAGDKMFSIYKAQLSTYSWISPRFGLGEVSKIALVYYEPMTMDTGWQSMAYPQEEPLIDNDTHIKIGMYQSPAEGIRLNFRPFVLKLEAIDINPMILKAQAIAEGACPAPGTYCQECDRVMGWMKELTAVT